MAVDAQRKALEQLMGSDTTTFSSRRSTGGSNPNYLTTFTDPRVCRPFLVGHCPHDLFQNTKFEQGPCRNQHNERLRQDYLETQDREKYGYEWEYQAVLKEYVGECDKRIESSQRRLETTYEEMFRQRQLMKEITELSTKISFSLDEIDVLGSQKQVAMALQQFHQVDLLQHEKKEKERELRTNHDPSGSQSKLQVCDVCGAYLSRLDNDRRLADHFAGKMHLGFQTMRTELKKIDELLKRGNIPKPAEPAASDRRDDYDRDRYDRGDRDRRGGHRANAQGGYRSSSGNYRGRGRGGGYRH